MILPIWLFVTELPLTIGRITFYSDWKPEIRDAEMSCSEMTVITATGRARS